MSFPNCFIKATNEFNRPEKFVPAPYFRKAFYLNSASSAHIKIAVCGFYRLFINGRDITKGALAPYISNPDDFVYYDCYTVDLKCGENVIGVLLGNGLVNNPGGWVWDFDKAKFRSAPHFSLQLTCGDLTVESDESFKTAPSPITFDDYRYGEHYDANLQLDGWNNIGFDDSDWGNAISAPCPRGELRLCEAEPIRVVKELRPVSIKKVDNGYLYDFGQNCAGVCRLTVKGKSGQLIEMRHGEMLVDGKLDVEYIWFPGNENGVHWPFDRNNIHIDKYICNGNGTETYTPSFTYHGFQYVMVTGISEEQATPDLLTYLVMNSELTPCGSFTTSNKTVSALQDMTLRSDLANFYYFPTDCPQREKNGWTADAALSAEQMLLKFDATASYKEWMRNICKAQLTNGAIPGIIPTGGWGYTKYRGPAWDCVLAVIPYYCYKYRGDKQIITETAASLIRYLHYLTTKKDSDGLIAFGLGDWCPVGKRYDTPKAPLVVTDTICAIDFADKAAVLFDAVGMKPQAEFARTVAKEFRNSFRAKLIDFDTMTVNGNCQTCQAMAIYYNLFEEAEKPTAFLRLIDFIKAADDHIDIGVLGAKVIFDVLSDFGYSDLALKMIARPDFPSFGYMVKRGYNTLWEQITEGPYDSVNHHFWGSVTAWFVKSLAGINYNPDATDLKRVDIRPSIAKELDDASAYFDSVYGRIESSWVKCADTVTLTVAVPDGMIGVIEPENGYKFYDGDLKKPLTSGSYTLIKK